MGGVDKLLAAVGGRPLLAWTLAALAAAPVVGRIVVVVARRLAGARPEGPWLPRRCGRSCRAVRRRQESVAAGLTALEALDQPPDGTDRVVLVHDGARPLPLARPHRAGGRATAARHGAAIPVVPIVETVKRLAGELVVTTVDRASLAAAQTPQGVRRSLLRAAFDALSRRRTRDVDR